MRRLHDLLLATTAVAVLALPTHGMAQAQGQPAGSDVPPSSGAPHTESPVAGVQPFAPGTMGMGDSLENETVGTVLGMDLRTDEGEEVDFESIARLGGEVVAIVSVGGVLDIGDREVAVPLEDIAVGDQELVLDGYTRERLSEMTQVEPGQYEPLPDDMVIGEAMTAGNDQPRATAQESAAAAGNTTNSQASGSNQHAAGAATDPQSEPPAGTDTTGSVAAAQPSASGASEIDEALRSETVGNVLDMDAQTEDGETVSVESIARSGSDMVALVSFGGVLGIGAREVAVPLEDVSVQDGVLTLSGYTRQRLQEMPEVEGDRYENLANDVVIGEAVTASN